MEEERHQHAMMTIESSVLGCGSDDWSVDSDYAFQDFNDEADQQNEHPQSASTPERAHRIVGSRALNNRRGVFSAGAGNPEDEVERVDLRTCPDIKSGVAVLGGEETHLLPENSVDENREDTAEPGRHEHHHLASEGRLSGDPGSSTDSAQILRLEQRMFLKVV